MAHVTCQTDFLQCVLMRERQNLRAAAEHVLKTLDEQVHGTRQSLWSRERQVFQGLWLQMQQCLDYMIQALHPNVHPNEAEGERIREPLDPQHVTRWEPREGTPERVVSREWEGASEWTSASSQEM